MLDMAGASFDPAAVLAEKHPVFGSAMNNPVCSCCLTGS